MKRIGKSQTAPERDYSAGVRLRDLPGLWRRDWHRAYAILTRDHAEEEEPRGWFSRTWYRGKTLFLELSYKLSPPRRLLFAICLILALLGLRTDEVEVGGESVEVWEYVGMLVASIVGLVFLLLLELADRVVVRDELEVARQLQRDLLPKEPPAATGYDFCFSYKSANTVGGDYFDFLRLDGDRLALVSADASGHGIASGLVMAIANSTLKLAADIDPAPAAVAGMMNRALARTGGPRAFLTLFYGLLELETGALEYVCAGHPFPLLRRSDGRIERLGTGSFPLGLRTEIELRSAQTRMLSGDALALYTDGIPEAVDEDGTAFGFDRLEEAVAAGGSASEIHDRVMADLNAFEADDALRDDRSLVVVTRRSTPGG